MFCIQHSFKAVAEGNTSGFYHGYDTNKLDWLTYQLVRSSLYIIAVSTQWKTRQAERMTDWQRHILIWHNILSGPKARENSTFFLASTTTMDAAARRTTSQAHTARTVSNFLQKTLISLNQICGRPPNSQNINPVDYAVWEAFQQYVRYHWKFCPVEELKWRITSEWQRFINKNIDQWRDRPEFVFADHGEHIIYVLFKSSCNLLKHFVVLGVFTFSGHSVYCACTASC